MYYRGTPQNTFLRPWQKKDLQQKTVAKVAVYDLDKSTSLESNKNIGYGGGQ
jgi:hypothetical protein